jgi:hypothetical protein
LLLVVSLCLFMAGRPYCLKAFRDLDAKFASFLK